MSEVIRQAVADKLAEMSISYSVRYVGETSRDGWKCDAWAVTLARSARVLPSGHNMPAVQIEEPFYTGLGLRTKPMAPIGKPYLPGTLAHEEWMKGAKPKAPHAADVLCSMVRDAEACETSFSVWCAEMGMDSDSIKALNTYQACERIGHGMRALFGQAELAALREALADY
jgi:hypothetical protein